MIQSYDIGSLPFPSGDITEFLRGAKHFGLGIDDEYANHFEQNIVRIFQDKLTAGIDVPNFPQFRDMNDMFLSMFTGVERVREGFLETARLTLKSNACCLPEVLAIKKNTRVISETFGKPFVMKICVTGPYTLSSFFPYRTSETFSRLGDVLSQVVDANIFCETDGCVSIVSVDEPNFGLVDDPSLDHGSEEREGLLKAWDEISRAAKTRNAHACIHLHNTSDELFWQVEHLDIVESHIDDPLYSSAETKRHLDTEDKVLKASICMTDFDRLIMENVIKDPALKPDVIAYDEAIAHAWSNIRKGTIEPEKFLETTDTMKNNAKQIIDRFGAERVPYVGPECGLRGFPTYATAIECLKRVAKTTKSLC